MRFILIVLFCFIGVSEGRYKGDPNKVLDTVPVLPPYYGQTWECVCSKDFYVAIDTVVVRHVWKNSIVPMDGPDVQCDKMRRIK